MAPQEDALARALALFAAIGPVDHHPLMGAMALEHDGQVFALAAADGTIYLKCHGILAGDLTTLGGQPFIYARGDGARVRMPFRSLPPSAMADRQEAAAWAWRALGRA